MVTIAQIQASWTGLPGGVGFTTIYVRSTAANPSPFLTFFQTIASRLPAVATVTVPSTGRLLDEATGKMTGVWNQGGGGAVGGTSSNTFAPQSGAQVKWDTGGFSNGRHVRGRMFIIPLSNAQYSTTLPGTIDQAACNVINGAATAMITAFAGNLVVWQRPLYERDSNGNPTDVLKRPGTVSTVTTATTPVKPATLRGRRDP
jgi:hypothetical protein